MEFQKLWELVMVRSSSEAICETVGSIMGQHCGKNRYLTPENFSKELVLRFNLGPLHLLNTASWELWKHPDPPPGGRPLFFKPEWPKESKNGFKTISYRPYPLVFFSNYFFRYQKSSKKSPGITSDSFPNNFYAL